MELIPKADFGEEFFKRGVFLEWHSKTILEWHSNFLGKPLQNSVVPLQKLTAYYAVHKALSKISAGLGLRLSATFGSDVAWESTAEKAFSMILVTNDMAKSVACEHSL